MKDTIAISEVFGPVLQGEGALIGKPTVFVRTGGCDYQHCAWCDTLYAVLPEHRHEWLPMTPPAILDEVLRLARGHPILVTLSGGNPALQPLEPLIDLGHAHQLTFALETQGSVARSWFAKLDYLVLSPKPPSSGMKTNWRRLEECIAAAGPGTHTVLKVVVFDEADYQYARRVGAKFPSIPLYLQVGNPTPPGDDAIPAEPDVPGLLARLAWLGGRVIADGWNEATVLPQLHV
ncbi:MAG: 7-carboxy-7-deazaguanine synthase QueE, partial [Armatimonadota bacterium]|nr:7-carboxy-7-deazaguanine synthase QueE [Armatimonadota bacterium]